MRHATSNGTSVRSPFGPGTFEEPDRNRLTVNTNPLVWSIRGVGLTLRNPNGFVEENQNNRQNLRSRSLAAIGLRPALSRGPGEGRDLFLRHLCARIMGPCLRRDLKCSEMRL